MTRNSASSKARPFVVECHAWPFPPMRVARAPTLLDARAIAERRLPAYDRIVVWEGDTAVLDLDGRATPATPRRDRRALNGAGQPRDALGRLLALAHRS